MSKDNRRFFEKKNTWSEVKDIMLGCYLVPYFSKIFRTKKPLLYVDCFAGKGMFDDGKKGSPLIALECLDTCLSQPQRASSNPKVYMRFIELNWADTLEANIPAEHRLKSKVIHGAFETEIIPLLQKAHKSYPGMNAFLYIDPYGVKALNMSVFLELPDVFSTAELLINLNSFGFIRNALRLRQVALRESEEELLLELDEYDPSVRASFNEIDRIAGGDYWQQIVDLYSAHRIGIDEAEKMFAEQFKQTLRKKYKYVLDMPIRLHPGNKPKYRMVHATNHPDGCTIMADNIFKRTDYLVVMVQNRGQTTLLEHTPENGLVQESDIDEKMLALIERDCSDKPLRLNELQARFFDTYGVICSTKHLSSGTTGSSLKRLEIAGKIIVIRDPATSDRGRPTHFWSESKNNTIQILRK